MGQATNIPVDRCPPKLAGGTRWVLARLSDAGLAHHDHGDQVIQFTSQGGLWVTAPYQEGEGPEIEAAHRQMASLWQSGDIVVYGRGSSDGSASYVYWRAGGVDHNLQSGLKLDQVEAECRSYIDRLIASAERSPHN
jgi:hypothetical protein